MGERYRFPKTLRDLDETRGDFQVIEETEVGLKKAHIKNMWLPYDDETFAVLRSNNFAITAAMSHFLPTPEDVAYDALEMVTDRLIIPRSVVFTAYETASSVIVNRQLWVPGPSVKAT